jgi:uncharacterized protein (DUF58 family)
LESKEEHLEIIKLQNLHLAAKIISEKLIQGNHFGQRVGYGAEFEQYRHYEIGDDLKRLDWKLFARSGKYLIKESPIESNLHVKLVLDLSGSMNYEEDQISRISYAKVLLASIAYLAFKQGDSLSLYFLVDGKVEQVTSAGSKGFQMILYNLETAKARGAWQVRKGSFPELKSRERELVIMASDFLQSESEWTDIVKSMVHPKKQLWLFQILGPQEMEMNLKGNKRFIDLESGESVHADAGQLVKTYNQKMKEYLDDLDHNLNLPKVELIRVKMQESIVQLLNRVLNQNSIN